MTNMVYGVNPPNDYKNKDHALWVQWKRTRSPQDLQKLLNQMLPIINREANKWAPSMSRSLLEAEGKRLAVEAFEKYDPNAGAALSTFLASRLQKLSRMVYSTQNTARLSETKTLLFHTYNSASNELRDIHGRSPTNEELSDHLGWSPKKLKAFQRQAGRKEFIESEEHPDDDVKDDDLVHFIYHDLTPQQKKIFEHRTGYLGAKILSGKEIMTELNLTQGQLSYQINLIETAIKRAKGHV